MRGEEILSTHESSESRETGGRFIARIFECLQQTKRRKEGSGREGKGTCINIVQCARGSSAYLSNQRSASTSSLSYRRRYMRRSRSNPVLLILGLSRKGELRKGECEGSDAVLDVLG